MFACIVTTKDEMSSNIVWLLQGYKFASSKKEN